MRAKHFLVALSLAAAMAGPARAEDQAKCQVPHELIEDDAKLPVVAQRFAEKKPVTIVAMGGASTAGTAAGDGALWGYPHALEEALKKRHPGVEIHVINVAVPRQTTEDMIQRFAKDVAPANPSLVIWETGTVDAVRGADLDGFAAAVQDGIAALRQHNFDIMLVDMQYNPRTESVIDFEPYLDGLRHSADLADVYLFRRFDVMKYWSDNGVFDFVDVPKGSRTELARAVYHCLGDAMAEAVDYGAR